jgi:hypothetical protein
MPAVPRFDVSVGLRPGGASQASPQAMGVVGDAVRRVGEQQADIMTEFLQRRAEARRVADESHYVIQGGALIDGIAQQQSLVPDRDQALAGFDAAAGAARDKLLSGIDDFMVQSRVAAALDSHIAARRWETGRAAFGQESADNRGRLDTDLATLRSSALSAKSDYERDAIISQAERSVNAMSAAGWLNREEAADKVINFRSGIQEDQARKLLNHALDSGNSEIAMQAAHALDNPSNFPGLLPQRREMMQKRLIDEASHIDTRNATLLAHQDAVADRNLKRMQGRNEASLLANIASGQVVTPSSILRLADTQQISAGGVEALIAANARAENGVDKSDPTLRLWHAIDTKQATSGMIFDALHRGDISRNTSVTMMRALDAGVNKQEDAVARGAFNTVKTALNGGAIEQGIIKDATPKAMWAQAQNEWTQRVRIGGENPLVVKDDILKRYAGDAAVPTWLAQPQLGVVRSFQDLAAVAAKTGAAFKAGTINQAEYDAQLRLLSQYKTYYPAQSVKQSAGAAGTRH